DRYGRTVADVRCAGKDVATEQVRAGMAWVYDKYAKGYEQLYPIQDAARARRAGLWADAEPVAPWEWRAGGRRS
ncbi:MAG: thermonuclease family protein, partial [Burkholderiaceae bacterium]|nr:thermonuclease family protein [Burkholderiaceae bacterium]